MKKNIFEAKNAKELCSLLGLPVSQAPKLEIRRNLALAVKKEVEKHKWTHVEAAKKAQIGRTVLTAVLNGNLDHISTDRLIFIAHNLGLQIQLKMNYIHLNNSYR